MCPVTSTWGTSSQLGSFGFAGDPWGEDGGMPEGWDLEGSKGAPGSSGLPPPPFWPQPIPSEVCQMALPARPQG